jgi:type IV pilus assembly protein PilA
MFKSLLARAREVRAAELEGQEGLEGGFTLIELMVVLLIIAILLAIAIPTFLGVTGSAKDRSAQSSLTNALTNAVAYYQNAQTYDANTTTATSQGSGGTDTVDSLIAAESTYNWVSGATACTTGNNRPCISVDPIDSAAADDGQGIVLADYSNSGTCWWVVNLQATPNAALLQVKGTGSSATNSVSFETASNTPKDGGVLISKAGTYYAEKTGVGSSNCNADYAINSAAFNWGDSFAKAGVN